MLPKLYFFNIFNYVYDLSLYHESKNNMFSLKNENVTS